MVGIQNIIPSALYNFSPFQRAPRRPKPEELRDFLKDNCPIHLNYDKHINYHQTYFGIIAGPINDADQKPLEKWISAFLKLACGELRHFDGEIKIDYLVECIDYANAFSLMARCYQLALQKAVVETNPRMNIADVFGHAVEGLAKKYPKEYLSIDIATLPFLRDKINPRFIQELEKIEADEIRRRQLCEKLGIAAIALVGASITAAVINSHASKGNGESEVSPLANPPPIDSSPSPTSTGTDNWLGHLVGKTLTTEPATPLDTPVTPSPEPQPPASSSRSYWAEGSVLATFLLIVGIVRSFLPNVPRAFANVSSAEVAPPPAADFTQLDDSHYVHAHPQTQTSNLEEPLPADDSRSESSGGNQDSRNSTRSSSPTGLPLQDTSSTESWDLLDDDQTGYTDDLNGY